MSATDSTCSVKDCNNPKFKKGWCTKHYYRWKRHGDPEVTLTREYRPKGMSKTEIVNWHLKRATPCENGCLIANCSLDAHGYPSLSIGGKNYSLHRAVIEVTSGKVPDRNEVVRHTCDTPRCINPAHLILGSVQDNSNDMVERGRSPRGEKSAHSRLTEADVKEIVHLYLKGANYKSLAERFGVHRMTINDIFRRRTWRHVTQDLLNSPQQGDQQAY